MTDQNAPRRHGNVQVLHAETLSKDPLRSWYVESCSKSATMHYKKTKEAHGRIPTRMRSKAL